uniref:Uncharacterized protein n=1 Tax=Anopheles merus TaxID=30066 RepID=A0A182V814_ANOME
MMIVIDIYCTITSTPRANVSRRETTSFSAFDCTSDLPVSDEPLSMYWPLVAVDEAVTWIGRLPLRAFVESLMFISEMLHEFLPAVWRNPCAQMLIAQPTTICVSCSVVMSIAIERGGLKLRARSA